MRFARHKRQIVLFLLAVILPAVVLIGLTAYTFQQERVVAATRAKEQQADAIKRLERELSARLDAIRLQVINRLMQDPHAVFPSAEPAVVFVAKVEGDRLIGSSEALRREDSSEFAEKLKQGEAQEFRLKNLKAAADAYRSALAVAKSPAQRGEANLRLARVLLNAGNVKESDRIYLEMLQDDARDGEGVGYRFYAAERLIASGRSTAAVTSLLQDEARQTKRLSLAELYMVRTLLASVSPEDKERIAELEEITALGSGVSRIQAQMATGSSWVAYGSEPWMVHVSAANPPAPGLLIVVSPAKVVPDGVKLSYRGSEGVPLGDAFPGWRVVEWSSVGNSEMAASGLPAGFWIAAVAALLGLAFFGGYLLLRDVNRDLHMTEVRAQFVASVSHELKTPLTAIRMYAETLSLGRSHNERARAEYLDTIVNESERLARLVDNVLDFSKIEQGKKLYRPCPMRLEDAAKSAMRALQFPLTQQEFQLRLSVADDLPELQADPDAIQQAILNLLTNAMKYSGDAREIDLRLKMRKGEALIEVVDRGLGLSAEEQKHIFDKFYRAPSHAAHQIAGTGLGLTLVSHIVAAHGGRIEVQSQPGAGSTFSILLPVAPAPMMTPLGEHA